MHNGPSNSPAKLKRREFLKMGAAAISLLLTSCRSPGRISSTSTATRKRTALPTAKPTMTGTPTVSFTATSTATASPTATLATTPTSVVADQASVYGGVYVITSRCTREGDCVEVCPVDCIVPGAKGDPDWPLFYIDPDTCISCGACMPVCPREAIFPEEQLPVEYTQDLDRNLTFFTDGPGYWEFDLDEERGF